MRAGAEFGILGPFEVRLGGQPVPLGGLRQRALLVVLVLHANQVVSTDRLVDQLWGEQPPARATHTVQVFVSRLRSALASAGDRLLTRPPGYVLEVGVDELDADRCERLYASARVALGAGDPGYAARLLGDAEALWRGPPLAEFTYEPFAQATIARLEELRLSCREELIEAELALGRHAKVVSELEALVREQPFRERPRGQLMLALYRCGRQAEALAAFQDARRVLLDELAVEPGPALRELERAILQQDASLEAVLVPAVAAQPEQLPGVGATDAAGAREVAIDHQTDQEPLVPADPVSGDTVPMTAVDRSGASAGRPSDEQPEESVRDDPGQPAIKPSAARATRKVVTVLCCEVTSSTALGERLDPELHHVVMDRCFSEIRSVVGRHEGTLRTFMQDQVMAVFGIPRGHEDDALRAVRAAVEICDRLPAVAQDMNVVLHPRTGVNTGLVLAWAGENVATGDPVNVAQGLQKAADVGNILLGSETQRLVRDAAEVEPLEPLTLIGRSDSIPVYRLVRVDPLAPGFARRLDMPLVGRERELRLLREAWGRAVAERGCHLFTLLGEAGVGKSRLVLELLDEVGDASCVLRGRCLPYGEGITFWPLTEALRPLGRRVQPVLERLSSGSVATPEELFLEVRRLLESLAAERPVILHVDDLQWAEPMLLDLLDHVVDLSRVAPILVLCAARLELLDDRPGWGGGKLNATTALVGPLGRSECEALLDQLADELDPQARSRVVSVSDGNPLFLEEMVALIRERGTVAVPATIHALLAERLEQLASDERETLERGAIEGEVFHRRAIVALTDERLATKLDSLLSILVRKELIRPHPATHDDDEAFRFRHLLLRDAAYDALPKQTRAELHHRFAGWLEDHVLEIAELDEIAGWHLEQAVRHRQELGRSVEPAVARRAADHLRAAGRRARDRGDVAAARNLFERAFELAPAGEPLRVRIGVDLAERLIEAGELTRADELLSAAERDVDAGALAALTRLEWMLRVQPHQATQTIEQALPGILRRLAEADDQRGMGTAHLVASMPHWLASRWTAAGEQARLAADHADKAGDDGLRSRALAFYVGSIIYGEPDARAIAQQLDAIERNRPGASLAARIELGRGQLARLEGRFDEARGLMQRAIERFHALGMHELEAACNHALGVTELSAGDPPAALAWLLRSDAILADLGQHSLQSTTQALIAHTQELLDNDAAARAAIDLAERLSAPEDVLNYAITHRVRARLALADDDGEAAERWARSAVTHAFLTDSPALRADAKLELARVLLALGRRAQATAGAHAALQLFASKGDRAGVDQTRALLDELDPACSGDRTRSPRSTLDAESY